MLICPICKMPLFRKGNTFSCQNNHCYDLSKEGYLNLKKQGRGLSGVTGDSREMLLARREVLNNRMFDHLATELVRVVTTLELEKAERSYIDVGCGEGFYTNLIAEVLAQRFSRGDMRSFGLDVSKSAAQLAAKKYDTIQFLVNDTSHGLTPIHFC